MPTQDKPSLEFGVRGMTCAACVKRVERALAQVDGVERAEVNLATERARVVYANAGGRDESLYSAVREAGYDVIEASGAEQAAAAEAQARESERTSLLRQTFISAALTLPIFLLQMVPMAWEGAAVWLNNLISEPMLRYVLFVPATLVQFGPGLRFYRLGWKSAWTRSPDMNTLVMLGTSAAYGYSLVATFTPGILPAGTVHVYYEASAAIITLILLGKYMEARAKGRTSEAMTSLLKLRPSTAQVERDGQVTDIPVNDVRTGDIVVIRPGDRLPVDGVVEDGSSYVDESMITGEPVPVRKEAGSEVVGGTINDRGSFRFRATKVGRDTVLAQIIRMVEAAQTSRPPIQALADRVVAVFVPAVLVIASLTFLGWMVFGPSPALTLGLVAAVSVLIIACPCAMGLATPTSVMVGTGKAAEMGVLFRQGAALEELALADTIVLDKTGTLTEGRPRVTSTERLGNRDIASVLALAASAESRSEHPLARAIVETAADRGLSASDPTSFTAHAGLGIEAHVDGSHVLVGSRRFLVAQDAAPRDLASTDAEQGHTAIYVAIDGRAEAALYVADPVKPSSAATIEALHDMGYRVALVTGDSQPAATSIGHQLGIDDILAEVLPGQKSDAVRKLQQEGRKVVFVGDGINDAPALAQADVGVAIGTGTDVAIETGDVILMSGDPRGLVNALSLARQTMRNIKQNLFWAFAYNVALIPVAAGALYPFVELLLSPVFAAAAMGVSSVFVLSNALRLKRFKPILPAEMKPA